MDPDLTNSKCSFWHFRLDANTDMKMEALTTYLAKDKNIKNVYLLNQNYSFGQAVAKAAKEYLARKRPDIKIVGEDLHPLAQVKDFAPYVSKMKAAGADTVITGNWGSDLALLIKAGKDAGLNVNFYTYYAGHHGRADRDGRGGRGQGEVRRLLEREQREIRRRRRRRGLQEEVQRRLLHDGDLHRHRDARQGVQGDEVDRPGEGGRRAGRHEGA